jgi:hypothetical protein
MQPLTASRASDATLALTDRHLGVSEPSLFIAKSSGSVNDYGEGQNEVVRAHRIDPKQGWPLSPRTMW